MIDNLFADRLSCWWKPISREVVVQGNVMTGSFDTNGTLGVIEDKSERVVVRNNTILGSTNWGVEPWGPGGPGGDWAAANKAFVNNFHAAGRREAVEAARFADPTYYDYRLQADSSLIGKAIGGGDRGAFRRPAGRIFYVGPSGNDTSDGTSDRSRVGEPAESRLDTPGRRHAVRASGHVPRAATCQCFRQRGRPNSDSRFWAVRNRSSRRNVAGATRCLEGSSWPMRRKTGSASRLLM